ncbi:MAG: flagellar hook-basal body complex protein FliE [Planctomycetota bacterium]|jgi:flagellar hook-basal body complex protein FliE|nr:flagellar hook-basal body complex protein FliE [Planctomycetota bacterium]
MANPLDPMRQLMGTGAIQPGARAEANKPAEAPKTADGKSFNDIMAEFVDQADQAQKQFDHAIEAVERGETDNLHQVMIAQNQAQMSLKLAAEVRNKLVEAYRDVMRTQF